MGILAQAILAQAVAFQPRFVHARFERRRAMPEGKKDNDALDQAKVMICDACCCCYDGFLFDDSCLGCMGSSTMCCLESEFCCKTGTDMLCLGCLACRCVGPSVCIKQQQQMCCCVSAIAIPPDDEVPMMVSLWGLNCYPKQGCCSTMESLTSKEDAGAGGQQIGG